jgi:hypothetical protein
MFHGGNMNPDELYALLPSGSFYPEQTLNHIREYDPHLRFPNPKFELWEIMSCWLILVRSGLISVSRGLASKTNDNKL